MPDTSIYFTDTTDEYVLKAATVGLISDTVGGNFYPNYNITREEMAVFLNKIVSIGKLEYEGYYNGAEKERLEAYRYVDDSSISSWAKESVYFMLKNFVILEPDDMHFRPKDHVTLEEALSAINSMVNRFNNIRWYEDEARIHVVMVTKDLHPELDRSLFNMDDENLYVRNIGERPLYEDEAVMAVVNAHGEVLVNGIEKGYNFLVSDHFLYYYKRALGFGANNITFAIDFSDQASYINLKFNEYFIKEEDYDILKEIIIAACGEASGIEVALDRFYYEVVELKSAYTIIMHPEFPYTVDCSPSYTSTFIPDYAILYDDVYDITTRHITEVEETGLYVDNMWTQKLSENEKVVNAMKPFELEDGDSMVVLGDTTAKFYYNGYKTDKEPALTITIDTVSRKMSFDYHLFGNQMIQFIEIFCKAVFGDDSDFILAYNKMFKDIRATYDYHTKNYETSEIDNEIIDWAGYKIYYDDYPGGTLVDIPLKEIGLDKETVWLQDADSSLGLDEMPNLVIACQEFGDVTMDFKTQEDFNVHYESDYIEYFRKGYYYTVYHEYEWLPDIHVEIHPETRELEIQLVQLEHLLRTVSPLEKRFIKDILYAAFGEENGAEDIYNQMMADIAAVTFSQLNDCLDLAWDMLDGQTRTVGDFGIRYSYGSRYSSSDPEYYSTYISY